MRRWNGWGDIHTEYHLPPNAVRYLQEQVGPGTPQVDVSFESAVRCVPPSTLRQESFLRLEPEMRLLHARGQSLPDWLELRSGRLTGFPEAVVQPACDEDVETIISFARKNGIALVPYGGGTSVVGHINPPQDGRPYISVDLSQDNLLVQLDETSRLAEFGAGVSGPALEARLNQQGYTLGHFPQSFELSTLGGWIATRSSGQQSFYYGRIENLFAGGCVITPSGAMELLPLPASAAGPDLRQLILGSEGRLGIITRAWVRIQPIPEWDKFYGVFFPDWHSGVDAVREIAQAGVPVSMLRLSNSTETQTTLALSGKEKLVEWAERGLRLIGMDENRVLLILGITGTRQHAELALDDANAICKKHKGFFTGETIGKIWRKSRFLTPYLRNTLWNLGFGLDTLETALPWISIERAVIDIRNAIRDSMTRLNKHVLVFSHLSHVYRDGASIYTTYLFPLPSDPDETLSQWKTMKKAASLQILKHGGTISHQHGVGLDHRQYLTAEKSPAGLAAIGAVFHSLDPDGLMNPGKLVETASQSVSSHIIQPVSERYDLE